MLWRAIPGIVRLGVFRQRRFLLRRALQAYAGSAVARLGRELFVLISIGYLVVTSEQISAFNFTPFFFWLNAHELGQAPRSKPDGE